MEQLISKFTGELPSNWIIKHYVRPSRWLAFITVAWGLIATLTGLVQSYGGLLACRVLLGLFEAGVCHSKTFVYQFVRSLYGTGLFPGCAVFLTTFYTKRVSLAISHSNVFAGLEANDRF